MLIHEDAKTIAAYSSCDFRNLNLDSFLREEGNLHRYF